MKECAMDKKLIEENAETKFFAEQMVQMIKLLDHSTAVQLLFAWTNYTKDVIEDIPLIKLALGAKKIDMIEDLLDWYEHHTLRLAAQVTTGEIPKTELPIYKLFGECKSKPVLFHEDKMPA